MSTDADIRCRPNPFQETFERALQHWRTGQATEAEGLCRQILESPRESVDDLLELAASAACASWHEVSFAFAGRAAAAFPDEGRAHKLVGLAFQNLGRHEDAIAALRAAVKLRPDDVEARNHLGVALGKCGRLDEAITVLQKALLAKPDYTGAHINLGNAFLELGRLNDAETAYRKALELDPTDFSACRNMARLLGEKGELDAAMEYCQRALPLDPESPAERRMLNNQQFALSVLQLLAGDFREGWRNFEARWESDDRSSPRRRFQEPMWDGTPLNGRRVLIHAEQGFGDSIQFIRYASMAAAGGGTVIVECPHGLMEVLSSVKGVSQVVGNDFANGATPLPPFDVHIPMMSLPLAFGTTLDTIPQAVPYLTACPERAKFWNAWLGEDRSRLRVGLVWAGNPGHGRDQMRSMQLRQLMPLFQIREADFISLQVDDRANQIAQLPGKQSIRDPSEHIANFADTAALISQLDLVIAVDTAVAHLAGALGRPVWVLLSFAPDWRWLLNRTDSPWYPTMRLFRQRSVNDWEKPIRELRCELRNLAQAQMQKQ